MNQKIRIKDIAARTGVSSGTVDRVLHNRGYVANDVRERVLQVMEEMGYQPNIMARTLANNRTVRIAAILPDFAIDPYWVQPKDGVEMAAKAVRHYDVMVEYYYFGLFDPVDFRRQAAKALASAPDAVLFAPLFLKEAEELLAQTKQAEVPVAMLNTDIPDVQALCYIGQDSFQSGVLAGRLLNFGLNTGDHAMVLNLDKGVSNARHLLEKARGFRSYFEALKQKHIVVHTESFEDFDKPGALSAWLKVQFQRYGNLNGFFVTNSRAYLLADALGQHLLQKVKIVGFDLIEPNIRLLADDKIRFLINQNAWHQGYLGIMAIVNHLILHKPIRRNQFLPLDIVVRENVDYYLERAGDLSLVVV